MKHYAISEEQLRQLQRIKARLYTETRMHGDEMRDTAQAIDAIVRVVAQLELPPEVGS